MKTFLRIAILVVASICGSQDVYGQKQYRKVSVCHVLSRGMANRVLNVEINGFVLPNVQHGSVLADRHCPERGLYLDSSPDDADPSVANFYKMLWSNAGLGITGKRLDGKFFGRLRLDHRTKKISIALTRVEDLIIKSTGDQPQ